MKFTLQNAVETTREDNAGRRRAQGLQNNPRVVVIKQVSNQQRGYNRKLLTLFSSASFLLIGVISGSQVFLEMRAEGMQHDWWRILLWSNGVWFYWAAVFPLVMWLSTRFPLLQKQSVWWPHLIAATSIPCLHSLWRSLLLGVIVPFGPIQARVTYSSALQALPHQFPGALLVYAGVLVLTHAICYYQKLQEQQLRESQLESLVSEAQLLSLRMQLHPHFLFNTLNSIAALVRDRQNENAISMLMGLSTMLRYALDQADRLETSLANELGFVRQYLEIEKMRFSDRLTYEFQVPEDLLDAQIPGLLLQPLAENSVRHGIAPRSKSGSIVISAEERGNMLVLSVRDDGLGLSPLQSASSSGGIGLSNTRSRLEQLYGERQSLEVTENLEGGVTVKITMPLQRSENVDRHGVLT